MLSLYDELRECLDLIFVHIGMETIHEGARGFVTTKFVPWCVPLNFSNIQCKRLFKCDMLRVMLFLGRSECSIFATGIEELGQINGCMIFPHFSRDLEN